MGGGRTDAERGRADAERTLTVVLGLTAAVLQTLLLFLTFLLGLTWGGWSWLAALGLGVLGLAVVIGMTVRRRPSVVAVPFVTGFLALGLSFLGPYPFGSA